MPIAKKHGSKWFEFRAAVQERSIEERKIRI